LGGDWHFIFSGGAHLEPEYIGKLAEYGITVLEGYGMSECSPVISANMPYAFKPGSVGKPLPNVELGFSDEGEILVKGSSVMKEYYKMPNETGEALRDGWLHTGDKGYLDEDGFLTIVDRYSRFAKLGGEMVSLGAVEKKIQDTPVLEGCDYLVTTIPDSAKGEKIVLLYQGEKDPKDVLSELRASGFPPIMLPSLAFAVEKVPKLGTGKADFTTAKKVAKELAGVK
jgi:acyl-[acyl-carrier-protein]-phospholipid O-acyltransferase/long-chain-fatty-acid--[acyl-carrier-protein] ligase